MSETLYDFLARRECELAEVVRHHCTCLATAESELEHVQASLRVVRAVQAPAARDAMEFRPEELEPSGPEARGGDEDFGPVADEPIEEPAEEETGSAGKIPELILQLLSGWMGKYPAGPTILEVARDTRLDPAGVRKAFWELRERGRAVVYLGSAPHRALHVAPLGFALPDPEELSSNQEKVLGYLAKLPLQSGDTVTPPSSAAVHEATGVPLGSLGAVVSDLERRGEIEVVERGRAGMRKPRYRVLGHRQLRQVLAEPQGTRDATAALMGDPAPGRSALAEKLAGI